MTLNKENMKALTDKYAKMCGENDTVEQNLFAEYGVMEKVFLQELQIFHVLNLHR